MRIVCAPESALARTAAGDLDIVLYERASKPTQASVGAQIPGAIRRQKLEPASRAWDLLSIALAVVATDVSVRRDNSPDGWTRKLDLQVAVSDPDFWTSQLEVLAQQLRFLTTDIWNVTFLECSLPPMPEAQSARPDQDSVVLLSGGLDSLVGAIDIVGTLGKNPYAVSQVSQGDKLTQQRFASVVGDGLAHLQLNHNANSPARVSDLSEQGRSCSSPTVCSRPQPWRAITMAKR